MSIQNLKVFMLGSVPMSLDEMALAPALISSLVKNRGYDFEFIDINLELFEFCNRDHSLYQEKIESLQDIMTPIADDTVIESWQTNILNRVGLGNYLIVNVFSYLSQAVALKLVRLIKKNYPNLVICMGGVGSLKEITGANNSLTREVIDKTFENRNSIVFGQLLLDNHLIDYWQSDTSTSELERVLPARLTKKKNIPDIDFGVYKINNYAWNGRKSLPMLGSHGCVRQCSFCDIHVYDPSYDFVEADHLTQQIIDVYQQTQISRINFVDSLVNGSLKNFENLLSNLAHSRKQGWLPADFKWSGQYICRPRSAQLDRIHQLLPQSGADNLVIGVETGSDRVRFAMDKKFTNQDLLYEIESFRMHGVKTSLLFFPAWPTETQDDFDDSMKLFQQLGEFAQHQVIDRVSLGTSGFELLDGTPIARDKHKIGLESGPVPFLWRCHSNPELNYWESIRRRLLMAAVCEYYGIKLDFENTWRRYLYLNLNRYKNIVIDYAGTPPADVLDMEKNLCLLPNQHRVKLSIINSGQQVVKAKIQNVEYQCFPGITNLQFEVVKVFDKELVIEFDFEFDKEYEPQWARYDSGDFYSKNGIYLNLIQVDHRDITMWGFDFITEQIIKNSNCLPEDFELHNNKRCVVQNTKLRWTIPEGTGLQGWILNHFWADEYHERQHVNSKLYEEIGRYS